MDEDLANSSQNTSIRRSVGSIAHVPFRFRFRRCQAKLQKPCHPPFFFSSRRRHTRYAFDREIFNAKTLTYSKASRHPFPSGKTGKHSDSGFDRSGASLPRLVFHRSGGNVPGKAWRPWYEAYGRTRNGSRRFPLDGGCAARGGRAKVHDIVSTFRLNPHRT